MRVPRPWLATFAAVFSLFAPWLAATTVTVHLFSQPHHDLAGHSDAGARTCGPRLWHLAGARQRDHSLAGASKKPASTPRAVVPAPASRLCAVTPAILVVAGGPPSPGCIPTVLRI